MNEWIQILVLAASVVCFAIGGTGHKWVRRYVLPIFLGVIGAMLTSWWQGSGYAICLCAVLCAGYGERTPYWMKFLVFCGYGLVSLWFGFTLWCVLTPFVCISLFALSNWKYTAKYLSWKIVEMAFGFLIGACYISSILNKW